MTARVGIAVMVVALTAALVWLVFSALPRWAKTGSAPTATTAPFGGLVSESGDSGRRIRVRIFSVGADGISLASNEGEAGFGATTAEQARRIVEAQIAPMAEPALSPVPAGTKLRALFVTAKGEAYVDLSGEVMSAHPGGATAERLTVYAIVNALTINLPAVKAVQILVDGKEVDTLAGHIDLRHPLAGNPSLVR